MFMNKCLEQKNQMRKKEEQSPYSYFDEIFESEI